MHIMVESLSQEKSYIYKYFIISSIEKFGIFLFLVGGGFGRKGGVKYSLAKYSSIIHIVDSYAFKATF